MINGIEWKQKQIVICSIFPQAMSSSGAGLQHQHHEGRPYQLAAAPSVWGETLPNGKRYTTETVMHAESLQQDMTAPEDGAEQYIPRPHPARIIAENLLDIWRNNIYRPNKDDASASPGIIILPDGVTEPTDEHIQEMYTRQFKYANQFIRQADAWLSAGKVYKIADNHRMWATWLGIAKPNEDPWGRTVRQSSGFAVDQESGVADEVAALQQELAEMKEMLANLAASQAAPPAKPVTPPVRGK